MNTKFDYLIVAGGKRPTDPYFRKILKASRNLVTVDRGGEIPLRLGIKPILHITDGDSMSPQKSKRLGAEKLIQLNNDKNISDLEYALLQLDYNKTKIVLGAHKEFEDRSDHLFSNLILASEFPRTVFADEKNWVIGIDHNPFQFKAPKGTLFSIVPLSMKTKIRVIGAEFEVIPAKPFRFSTHGISNRCKNGWVKLQALGTRAALLFVLTDITRCKLNR